MSNVWGSALKISIFGESHGEGVGVVIGGLPPGEEIDREFIAREMKRRAPGRGPLVTPRSEEDEVEIMSGVFRGKTTGAPLCGFIRNKDTRSGDYATNLPRPGHADLTAHLKYRGFADHRGGGHFSGRLTAPLVFVGSLAKAVLRRRGIVVGAHIKQIGRIYDRSFDPLNEEQGILAELAVMDLPLLDPAVRDGLTAAILEAKELGDSLGGVVECCCLGLPAGLGAPFFDSMESLLASMMFSIPAVKGVEFGGGFALAALCGSQARDELFLENGRIKTLANHNGGLNGGVTNGMPLLFSVAVKPTASIAVEQRTVDLESMTEARLKIEGRHDPCIVPRVIPVVEAGAAICVLDRLLFEGKLT
ncbi:MAG: chorismate synthase [Clostridiales bacterium]|nr:chorismate synthase [Clostridiales bacterium]